MLNPEQPKMRSQVYNNFYRPCLVGFADRFEMVLSPGICSITLEEIMVSAIDHFCDCVTCQAC